MKIFVYLFFTIKTLGFVLGLEYSVFVVTNATCGLV